MPVNWILTGITGEIKAHLKRQNFENWPVTIHSDSSYLDHYVKQDLVYLTADSENTVDVLDPNKAYIIGGIVDRNRYKNLTLDKANKDGIAHARLPINHFIQLKGSTILTVNHVFEIVVEWY